jgi:Flavodoxin
MRALVIYESMFGGTRRIAEAIAEGVSSEMPCRVVRAADVVPEDLSQANLVVVGAPTHAHGLPRPSTRKGSADYPRKSEGRLTLEPGADVAPGVREWLSGLGDLGVSAAAFDTRAKGPRLLTGQAGRAITRSLRAHGFSVISRPESFLTTKNQLLPGETDRAVAWGKSLSGLSALGPTPTRGGVGEST